MAESRTPEELSQQDATFLFINNLQENLAKSGFVNSIKSRESVTKQTITNEATETTIPVEATRSKKDSAATARITRLKPPTAGK
ncbi:uncharacterized protein Z518_09655 [Rhinocladiella mackenziei CBS 650.93]|uniref:Uncharacterized protein n=1 Tax=Rhinocladiella mackenziei CBS 650.93 TaxID=1442369 RepID=A0A0D2IV61_9EURO|nr:uncharacterized protein Z518_09655 [Rhinocladiella mackenziei CBS 650.93]KIX00590.1 hypothetical protein Z518_09655 [Rhinocladiella mackenziei CBS 650.93]